MNKQSGIDKLLMFVADILNLEVVYPEDNFIELGGDSLLAMNLIFKIEDEWGCEPEIGDIFALSFEDLAIRYQLKD
jgi:acyl carrier protein